MRFEARRVDSEGGVLGEGLAAPLGGAASPFPPANHIRILGKAHYDTSGISTIEDKKLQESMLLTTMTSR